MGIRRYLNRKIRGYIARELERREDMLTAGIMFLDCDTRDMFWFCEHAAWLLFITHAMNYLIMKTLGPKNV